VEYLIDSGANIDIQDRIGVNEGEFDMQNYFITFCSFLFLCQRTPLHWAAKRCHFKIVKVLLRKKADMHIKDEDGVCV